MRATNLSLSVGTYCVTFVDGRCLTYCTPENLRPTHIDAVRGSGSRVESFQVRDAMLAPVLGFDENAYPVLGSHRAPRTPAERAAATLFPTNPNLVV